MFGIGFPELLVILVIAFLVLGPDKVIALSRTLGRMAADLKKKSGEVEEAVLTELGKISAGKTPKGESGKENKDDVQNKETRNPS